MPKCLGNAQTSKTLGQILGEHAVEKILDNVISTDLHLYVMKLWYSFFDIFVSGEVGNAQTWEVMALKKPIKPPQLAKIFPSISYSWPFPRRHQNPSIRNEASAKYFM